LTIKIFDKIDGKWISSYEWKAHNGSIWKIEWANPEFGQIIASCSFDRQVAIWEEPTKLSKEKKELKWTLKTTLVDFLKSVVDIKFSPKQFGLQIATACLDGHIRIYEASDIMNLSYWQIIADIESNIGITSISWNPSRIEIIPTFCASTKDGSIKIYQYIENSKKWIPNKQQFVDQNSKAHEDTVHSISWAPNLGRSFDLIASCSKDSTLKIWMIKK